MKNTTTSLVISYCCLILIFGFMGIFIAKRRTIKNGWVACYGILMFFVISIPLMMEGSAILELDHLDINEVQKLCIANMSRVTDDYNPLTVALVKAAKRFDLMSELVLDGYMCTKNTCPCYSYDIGGGLKSEDLFKNETEALILHDRTFDVSRNDYDSYMFFTTNTLKSFKNANACFQTWKDIFQKIVEKQEKQQGGRKGAKGKMG